jgi:competence CoiA-like predicted nuclease
MLYAVDRHGNKLRASRGIEGLCKLCGESLIARCGEIKIHHWAHRSGNDCDDWHEPESDWHLYWKSLVPPERCEVIIERNGKKRRADLITAKGTVIELQHSYLSPEEICAREEFYGKMIWLFDVRDCCVRKRGEIVPRLHFRARQGYHSFRWKHARQHVGHTDYSNIPVYLDIGSGQIFRLHKFHSKAPVGGWGDLAKQSVFEQWLINACGTQGGEE